MQLTLPEIITPRGISSKDLLRDSRKGSGRALKWLRAELRGSETGRRIAQQFAKEKRLEEENTKQREKLDWHKIAASRVKQVDTSVRTASRYTDVMCTGRTLPPLPPALAQERAVAAAAARAKSKNIAHLHTDTAAFY